MKKRIQFLKWFFSTIAGFLPVIVLFFYFNHVLAVSVENAGQSVIYFDMVLDEANGRLFGTDFNGNKIDVIDTTTLSVVTSIPVGTQPAGIDLSVVDDEFAVALFGEGQLKFYSLTTLSVTGVITPAGSSGQNRPYDVIYGRPGRLYSVGNPDGGSDYVHTIDTINKVEIDRSDEPMRAAPRLAITADHNTLYVSEGYFLPEKIYRYDISTDTPVKTAVGPHGPMRVNTMAVTPDGSKVFSSRGQIWNGDLTTQLGSFTPWGEEIEYSSTFDRFFISTGSQIDEYFGGNYAYVRSYPVGSNAGVARLNDAETMLYVSTPGGVVEVNLAPPVEPVIGVNIEGLAEGYPNVAYTFTANAEPISATQPLTYVWTVQAHGTFTFTNQGTSHSLDITWSNAGSKSIIVTAVNKYGSAVAAHTIVINTPPIYLPVVLKP